MLSFLPHPFRSVTCSPLVPQHCLPSRLSSDCSGSPNLCPHLLTLHIPPNHCFLSSARPYTVGTARTEYTAIKHRKRKMHLLSLVQLLCSPLIHDVV